jgi:hypothetical protein
MILKWKKLLSVLIRVKIGSEVRKECCSSSILFNLYSENLNREALKGFGDLKIGQIMHTVKYSDDLVLLAKEEMVLCGKIDDWKAVEWK